MSNMITDTLEIENNHTIESAPKYPDTVKAIKIKKAIIVRNGTEGGRATIDLQCIDSEGNQYVIMATARILKTLSIVANENYE